MNRTIRRINTLSSRAFNNAKTIAIVGNGGISPSDNEVINQCDCVVRFNNYATREKIEYTAERFRCDTLFSTFDLHSTGAEPATTVIAIPFPFHAKDIPRKLNKWYPKSAPFVLNPYVNMELCDALGLDSLGDQHPIPSVGLTAVWHIYQLIKFQRNWNPKIHICGFNWYSDKDKLTIQGRKMDMRKAGHFNHHYREEMKWMIDNIMFHPNFSFSSECFEILQAFKPHIK